MCLLCSRVNKIQFGIKKKKNTEKHQMPNLVKRQWGNGTVQLDITAFRHSEWKLFSQIWEEKRAIWLLYNWNNFVQSCPLMAPRPEGEKLHCSLYRSNMSCNFCSSTSDFWLYFKSWLGSKVGFQYLPITGISVYSDVWYVQSILHINLW